MLDERAGSALNTEEEQGLYKEDSDCSGTNANNWQVGTQNTKKSSAQKLKQSVERGSDLRNQRNALPTIYLIKDEHLEYTKSSKKSHNI